MKISYKHEIKPQDEIANDKIVNFLIKNRGIKNIPEFLDPTSPLKISLIDFNPKYKLYLIKVVKLLKDIKKKDQMIVVYTDYDADGITGGAILWETLHLLGFKVMPYVPHRKLEGYGFSKKGIDNIKKKYNPSLIISVDHGITKVKEIAYAVKKGIKVIVTDHHLKGDKIPKAEAIFHIPELSGSGVAYFFAKEIYMSLRGTLVTKQSQKKEIATSRSEGFAMTKLQNNFQADYLALASIGTIADLVPLTGPSRSIVKYGLKTFPTIKRFGIKHILKEAGIEGKEITPYEIGFIIAPRINAVGRLESAIDALRLLCTNDELKALALAKKIGQTNTERQDLVKKSVDEARLSLRALAKQSQEIASPSLTPRDDIILPKLIILVSDHWHEGIIGLIASKIAEEFYRPTLVLTKSNGNYKGSARSIPSFHITNFLRGLKKHLIDVGGHAQAAGFTIEKDKLSIFTTIVDKIAKKIIKDKDLERKIQADLKIPLSKINLSLVKSLEQLAPFGMGNPKPTFYSQGKLIDAKLFGKTNNHLKIFVDDLELIVFNQADKFKDLSRGQKIDVVYSLEVDKWNGREKLRGKVIFLPSYKFNVS